MNFGFSEEQELLRSEARKFLDERCPMEEVRRIAASAEGVSPDLWKQMAELGWLGLTIPERHGGAGLSWIDLIVLLEETGRTLFPSPLISTTLTAAALLDSGNDAQQARWLPALADGSLVGTLALLDESDCPNLEGIALRGERDADGFVLRGDKRFVADAGQANVFVVAFRTGGPDDPLTLALVPREAAGVSAQNRPTLDETKRTGDLILDGVRVGADNILGTPGQAGPAIALLLDRGALAVTAEMIGAAEGALALTVQYAKDRIQFGAPIGHYQGVKHPLAESYVDIECMKSLLYFATWALDASPDEVPLAASKAKAFASEGLSRMGITGIQLHGAVGYTQEYDIQLYLRRSKWARPMFGDEDYHYDRIATLGGL
jgi:alkylation response protein AidB-like acyl-CoA dehydrogenase